jgi:hypothetical protein
MAKTGYLLESSADKATSRFWTLWAPIAGVPGLTLVSVSTWDRFSPEAIVHFAIEVLWKSSVWPTSEVKRIDLGPYQEPLRLFLRSEGKAPLPDRINVHAGIPLPENVGLATATCPNSSKRSGSFFHWFRIPGIEFLVTINPPIDDINHRLDVRTGCSIVLTGI